ncbi:hypothetical protein JI739_18600 [Ramlibacter sp. AW1]|uniref:DUF5672 domain-containing protein n=1 Tax=Ramlibacter aurantiacus TaxID=2801330 RepID=A0A936ZRM9_9BURK|nr:DUF5672 family protein [Ramlibacter aurantiacus]MBL0422365.1 hypothetical protein [Ramlibacter aurantiacus]
MSLNLPQVTLCAADSATPRLAAQALARCTAQARFARTLLFTHADLDAGPALIIKIAPLESREAYSNFMLSDLGTHIETSHVLVVQWDGFITDAACWDDAFLDYDYIGARWPAGLPGRDVGNGGFSLRSRRLLEALRDPRLRCEPGTPEDVVICSLWRDRLEEQHGIRFAPLEIAARFAYELDPRPGPTFGFHGMFNLPDHLQPTEVLALVRQLQPRAVFHPHFALLAAQYMVRGDVRMAAELVARLVAAAGESDPSPMLAQALGSKDAASQLLSVGRFLALSRA